MWPVVWGPAFWDVIHLVAFVHPPNPSQAERSSVEAFYRSVGGVLPCPGCAAHFAVWQTAHPVQKYSGTRQMLLQWTVDLHNEVNVRNGKNVVGIRQVEKNLRLKFFERQEWLELKRVQQVRREDHKEMQMYRSLLQSVQLGEDQIQRLPVALQEFWKSRQNVPISEKWTLELLLDGWRRSNQAGQSPLAARHQAHEQGSPPTNDSPSTVYMHATIVLSVCLALVLLAAAIGSRRQESESAKSPAPGRS